MSERMDKGGGKKQWEWFICIRNTDRPVPVKRLVFSILFALLRVIYYSRFFY